jgi:membrane protein implicated in regulation of membrane protease activity
MGIVEQVFTCIAIPFTLVLIVQTVMMFLGMGEDGDGLGDDIPDEIGEIADDVSDGVFGDADAPDIDDASGFEGLRIFTVRGIVAFFVVFGWVGAAMASAGAKLYFTVPVAAVCGFAMMLVLALLFRAVMKLRSDGNTDNRNAVGVSGRVQLTIPAARSGEGKVHVMLQGSYVERDAVTDDESAIPTGSEIVVVGVSGLTTLVVRKK